MLSEGVVAHITLQEGQAISFTLRDDLESHVTGDITTADLDKQQHDTQTYWYNWITKCKYKGRWREVVTRSLVSSPNIVDIQQIRTNLRCPY